MPGQKALQYQLVLLLWENASRDFKHKPFLVTVDLEAKGLKKKWRATTW